MTGNPEAGDKLYQRLMQMQQQAFAAGRFEVAYHLMAAAVHAAEELNRVELLDDLEALASSRQKELDQGTPSHTISTAAAHGRGNSPLFSTLATTAAAARGRIVADAAIGRMRDRALWAD